MTHHMRTELQQECVEALIKSKAVDLKAISSTMGEFAERAALTGGDLVTRVGWPFLLACGWPGPEIFVGRQQFAARGLESAAD
jgi:hypothetical protein